MKDCYHRMDDYFVKKPGQGKMISGAGKILSGVFCLAYAGLCIRPWMTDRRRLDRVLLVPASCYVSGSLLRSAINAPRPADKMTDLKGTGLKGGGKSFPSRHSFSAAVIAAAFSRIHPLAGAAASILALLMAAERVLEGAHWIRDAAAGLLYGSIFGWLGFFGKDMIDLWRRPD